MKSERTMRRLLAAIGDLGPSTATEASKEGFGYQRADAASVLGDAEDLKLVTRNGFGGPRGMTPVYALTPAGCAWLDAQEAGEATKGAAE